jgi:hypothetical protein
MMLRALSVFAFATFLVLDAGEVLAQQYGQGNLPNHLFSQYATAPGASQSTAGMYPAPHYVPPHVGNSWYTYQALMPHEMMYVHQRNYYNYDYSTAMYGSGASLNKTSVVWQSGANHYAPLPFTKAGLSKLMYKVQASKYCLDGNCAQQAAAKHRAQWAAATANCPGGRCR